MRRQADEARRIGSRSQRLARNRKFTDTLAGGARSWRMGYVAALDDDGGMLTTPASSREIWDGLIRQHDRKVVLSLIALGIDRERARDLAQATWARLYEQHQDGKLASLELPGLAIRQARFLAIDSFRHSELQRRALAMARVVTSEDGAVSVS